MTSQFRAELLKIRSTRTAAGLVLGMVALILLFSLLSGLLTEAPNLVTTEDQRGLLVVGAYAAVFSTLAGIMLVTSEYRYGTIKPTFLFTPRRFRVMGAKVAAGVLAGFVFGIVGTAIGFGVGYACLAGRGIDYALNDRQTALLLLGTVAGTGAGSAWASAPSSVARWRPSSEFSPGPSSRRVCSLPFSPGSAASAPSTPKMR
jgi:ABC-2 type transport system permease protein